MRRLAPCEEGHLLREYVSPRSKSEIPARNPDRNPGGDTSTKMPVQTKEKRHMSKKAAEHHLKAAEHHEHAARHHKEAAKHHQAGSYEKAAHHAHTASGHEEHADYHAGEAAKAHVEEHGSK